MRDVTSTTLISILIGVAVAALLVVRPPAVTYTVQRVIMQARAQRLPLGGGGQAAR